MNVTWNDPLLDLAPETAAVPGLRSRQQLKKLKRFLRNRRYSASLVVDLGNTTIMMPSIIDIPFLSGGGTFPSSGAVIGSICDLLNANTFCNLFAVGSTQSGQLRLAVQTSDDTVSGNFTDPTSGLAQLPTSFSSGGVLVLNPSAFSGGVLSPFTSGNSICSGFFVAAGFQRIGRYARVNALLDGAVQFGGSLAAGFITNLKTTGSGGGFSFQPGSGVVNV